MADSSSSSEDSEPELPHPRAKTLHSTFDGCIAGSYCGRVVYSTDAMEALLCRRGWDPEDARRWVARTATADLGPWAPDFLE